jgi:Na+-translocating ferredoxin:NAD+ oxidoreductase RnfE subunit
MTDTTDPNADREGGGRADVRLVVGVAVLFALLGAVLTRVADGASVDGALGVALALLVVTAAVAVFGAGVVRTAADLLRP